jgi:hypothetical protein
MDLSKLLSFATEFEKAAKAPKMWGKKPHGWKEKSVKQYSKTMTKGEEHPFTECTKKMKGKVDNPEAFCASVKDISKGTTGWRGGDKKKKKAGLVLAQENPMDAVKAAADELKTYLAMNGIKESAVSVDAGRAGNPEFVVGVQQELPPPNPRFTIHPTNGVSVHIGLPPGNIDQNWKEWIVEWWRAKFPDISYTIFIDFYEIPRGWH